MVTVIRCGVAVVIGLLVTGGIAAEHAGAAAKDAVDALVARLDNIGHDRDMTTAKKATVAGDAMEKFNQQYKGKPLTIRLKIQDVVPYDQGHYLTANRPDLEGVQFYAGKFAANLSSTEALSVTKESVLAVTGMVSAGPQPKLSMRSSAILKPGGSLTFPLRANSAWQITLDNVDFKLEAATKTTPDTRPTYVSGSEPAADKTKVEQSRTVDDVKVYFLKGIFQTSQKTGSTNTGTTGRATGQNPGSSTRPGYGYATNPSSGNGTTPSSGLGTIKAKHNRIYTAAEIIQKFGNPSSRSSKTTTEEWVFKCKDGAVHVHFTEVGYSRGSATSRTETLRLEVKSVDFTSTGAGSSRF